MVYLHDVVMLTVHHDPFPYGTGLIVVNVCLDENVAKCVEPMSKVMAWIPIDKLVLFNGTPESLAEDRLKLLKQVEAILVKPGSYDEEKIVELDKLRNSIEWKKGVR